MTDAQHVKTVLARIFSAAGVVLRRDAAGVATVQKLDPWQFARPDGSVGVCSWCEREHGHQPDSTSHGVCPRHFSALLEEARRAA